MRSLLLLLPAALLISGGCTDSAVKTYPVRGVVVFPDGKPLREGTVEFELIDREKSNTATAEIQPDGSFQLGTFALDDGARVGKHRAVVIADQLIGNGYERPGLIPESQVHPRYREFRTSKLVFEVKPEINNIIITVDYAPEPETAEERSKR
jgi:hypothetical protein